MTSLLIYGTPKLRSCHIVDFPESFEVNWQGKTFQPLSGFVGFYEFLRSCSSGTITGIELHLATNAYDRVLSRIMGFAKFPTTDGTLRWRCAWSDEPSDISWEQILTQNPFISSDGEIVLVLDTTHLSDSEREQLSQIVRQGECDLRRSKEGE